MKPHSKQTPRYILASVDQSDYFQLKDNQSEKYTEEDQNDQMLFIENSIDKDHFSNGTQKMGNERKNKRKRSQRYFKSKNQKKPQVLFSKTYDQNFFNVAKREPQRHEFKQNHRTISTFEAQNQKEIDPRVIQIALRYGILSKKPKNSFHEIVKKKPKKSNDLNLQLSVQKRTSKPTFEKYENHDLEKILQNNKKTLESVDVPQNHYNINFSLMLDRKRILHSAKQSYVNKIHGTVHVTDQNGNNQNLIKNDERKNNHKIQLFLNEQIEIGNRHLKQKINKKEIAKTCYHPFTVENDISKQTLVEGQTHNRFKVKNQSNLKNWPNKMYFPQNQRFTKHTNFIHAKNSTQRVQLKNQVEQNHKIAKGKKSNVDCNRKQSKIQIIPGSIVFKKKESSESKKVQISKITKNIYNQALLEEKETFKTKKLQKNESSFSFLGKFESKQILERKKSIKQPRPCTEGSPPRQSKKQNYLTKNQELVFVFDSKDHSYIAEYLLQNGWNLFVPGKLNSEWTLKWVNNPVNSQILRLKDGQFYNHFHKSFELTSKSFLSLNLKASQHFLKTNQFFPETYDIGNEIERDEFIKQFKFNVMMNLLENIICYCFRRDKIPNLLKDLIQNSENQYDFSFDSESESILSSQSFNAIEFENYRQRDPNFQINIFLVILAIKYYRKERAKHDLDFREKKTCFLRFKKDQFDDNFQILQLYSKSEDISKSQDQKGLFSYHYATPSDLLLQILIREYCFFSKLNKWKVNLQNRTKNSSNIWIVKPSSNARGNGIYLETNLGSILKSAKDIQSRIVQKYIQKPLLFQHSPYPFLNKHKFDIRQWVLLKSLDPLEIYMFSHFYIRLASEKYELYPIENNKVHLTNFTANKEFFDKQQDSIISSDEFRKLLKQEHNIEWQHDLQPNIKKIIIKSIQSCQEKLEVPQNGTCFQLLGYDIFIDEQFRPWLIEVNMSPACEQRTPWLTDYLKNMNEGLLDIVLPKSHIPKGSKCKREQYWQRIWFQDYHFTSKDCKLQVVSLNLQIKNKLLKQNQGMKPKINAQGSSSKMRTQNINKKTIQKGSDSKMIQNSEQDKDTLNQQNKIKNTSQQIIDEYVLNQQIEYQAQNDIINYKDEEYKIGDLAQNLVQHCFDDEEQQSDDIERIHHISQDMSNSLEEIDWEIQNGERQVMIEQDNCEFK